MKPTSKPERTWLYWRGRCYQHNNRGHSRYCKRLMSRARRRQACDEAREYSHSHG